MNKKFKLFHVIIIVLLFFILAYGMKMVFGRNSSVKKMSASFTSFTDTKKKALELNSGDIITIKYDIGLKSGTLSAEFKDSTGNILENFEPNISGNKVIKITKDDIYEIIIQGDEAKGCYEFEWVVG